MSELQEFIKLQDAKELEKKLEELLKTYQSYTSKVLSLEDSFQKDMKLLQDNRDKAESDSEKTRYDEALKKRQEAYKKSLIQAGFENEKFNAFLNKDLSKISKKAVNKALRESDKSIDEARKYIKKERAVAPDDKERQAALDELEEKVNLAQGKAQDLKSKMTQEALKALAEGFTTCATAVRHFNEPLADSFEIVSSLATGAMNLFKGLGEMSTNPVQGAGSIVTGIMGVVGTFAKRNKDNKDARREYNLLQIKENDSALAYNKILRERLRLEKQIGETSTAYYGRKSEELGKQQTDINSEYESVKAQLQDKKYVSDLKFVHRTWFRKARTDKVWDTLGDMSFEEMEELHTAGKFEGDTLVLFERLKALKEEGQNVEKMIKELEIEMQQAWTGTNTSSIADSITQGFLDGKRSAEDFAESFEDMMRKAMMQAVKMKHLEGPLDDWYKEFAKASEEGLTEDKINELRESYNKIIEAATKEATLLEEATNINLTKDTAKAGAEAQKGLAAMTQDTANELNGRFSVIQLTTAAISDNVSSIQKELIGASIKWLEIAENTYYCRRLETIENDMRSMKGDINSMALKGIRLLR